MINTNPPVSLSEKTPALNIPIRNVVSEASFLELASMKLDEAVEVINFISHIDLNSVYMFFSPESIELLVGYVSNNLPIRRFVFGLHERVRLFVSTDKDLSLWMAGFPEDISVGRENYVAEKSVIPQAVSHTLCTVNLDIEVFIKANLWVLPLYIGIATGAFNSAISDISSTSAQIAS